MGARCGAADGLTDKRTDVWLVTSWQIERVGNYKCIALYRRISIIIVYALFILFLRMVVGFHLSAKSITIQMKIILYLKYQFEDDTVKKLKIVHIMTI